ncbi:hypothetical protein PFTANZ_06074, partial [Plasmodium falciparum Tanzania (2000708)]
GIGAVAVNAWKDAAIIAAKEAAIAKGAAAGKVAGDIKGMEVVTFGLQHFGVDKLFPDIFKNFVNTRPYNEIRTIASSILGKYKKTCLSLNNDFTAPPACTKFQLSLRIHLSETNTRGIPAAEAIPKGLEGILGHATKTAKTAEAAKSTKVAAEIAQQQTALIEAGFNSSITSINASIFAIVPTTTSRLLCECKLYAPSNYDNNPEMKAVIQDFDRQTSERYKKYEERMIKNRHKCKEQCDKDIQKIILKDKIEKELTEKFAALETNITTKDIPTCVCEESLADKTEKFCLQYGYGLGGGGLQSLGLLGGIGHLGINAWKTTALKAAITAAKQAGAAEGAAQGASAGMVEVISGLKALGIDKLSPGMLESFFAKRHYADVSSLPHLINMQYDSNCSATLSSTKTFCGDIANNLNLIPKANSAFYGAEFSIKEKVTEVVAKATNVAEATKSEVTSTTTATLTKQKTSEIAATYMGYQTTIIASIVAILIIVLVMVIIYLILRYRRKKKMKKKLQYIKLLKD